MNPSSLLDITRTFIALNLDQLDISGLPEILQEEILETRQKFYDVDPIIYRSKPYEGDRRGIASSERNYYFVYGTTVLKFNHHQWWNDYHPEEGGIIIRGPKIIPWENFQQLELESISSDDVPEEIIHRIIYSGNPPARRHSFGGFDLFPIRERTTSF